MKDVAMGISGEQADPDAGADSDVEDHAGERTVLQYWKDFTRALFLENDPLDKLITNSVRQVTSPYFQRFVSTKLFLVNLVH